MSCEHGWHSKTDCDECTLERLDPQALHRIDELETALDDLLMQGVEGPTKDWMMVPRVEWDQAVERAKLKPR